MANPFQTPPNEQSFSSLIDDAILATGKPGSLLAAIQHANLCIRECQGLGLFARDLDEDTLTVDTDPPFTWTRPPYFRTLRTVKYNKYINGSNCPREKIFPKFLMPGKIQKEERYYFYAADDYYAFNGVCNGDTIDIATYYWATPLSYYAQLGANTNIFPGGPYPTRLAYYDIDAGQWMYLVGTEYETTTGNPTTDASYQALSSNWLTTDWRPLILSGTKAKIWNSVGDPRGNVEYSLYKQNQTLLRNTTGREAEGF